MLDGCGRRCRDHRGIEDRLAELIQCTIGGRGRGLAFGDVNGDGALDLVVATPGADVGGVADVGAVDVWLAAAGLTGTPAPSATLLLPGRVAGDRLTRSNGQGLRLADVTGDGAVDVIAVGALVDVGGVADVGSRRSLRARVAPEGHAPAPGGCASGSRSVTSSTSSGSSSFCGLVAPARRERWRRRLVPVNTTWSNGRSGGRRWETRTRSTSL